MTNKKEGYKKMKIRKIGQLIGGQVISRVKAKTEEDIIGKTRILLPKAIKNGIINHEDLSEISIKTELDENKLTKAGDIVIKLSQPYDAAYITEKDEEILVTSYCLLLRERDISINPRYLVLLINSEAYKEQAMLSASGATVPMLTKGKIENIDLKLNLERQEEIIKMNDKIKQKEEIFNEIIRLEKLKLENILRGEN
mgnify:CR=1 FL=1